MADLSPVPRELLLATLMAGAGLAATAAGGPVGGIVGLLVGGAASNQFHDAIKGARDWYTEWTKGPGGAARNFDITALAARAILGITHTAAPEFKGNKHGREMVRIIANLKAEHWEAALRSPGFEALGDEQLVQLTGLAHGGISDHAATRSVWADLIKAALLAANPIASIDTLTPQQEEGLAFTARTLWERFAVQFNGELRSDPKHGGRALVAVQLLLANRTREEIARVDEAVRTGTTSIVDALNDAAGGLRDRLRKLEDKHDAHEQAESERHAILAKKLDEIPGSRVLGRLLEQPWEQPRRLPFHFSTKGVPLHGDLALGLGAQVKDFLSRDDPAHWWLWTGLEGAGKSRLAMEACRVAAELHWDAGFLPLQQLRELQGNWHEVMLARNTLLVCDYVGLDTAAVRSALIALGQHRGEELRRRGGRKLRLILLERHSEALVPTSAANLPPQWCVDLFQSPLSGTEFLERQYPRPGDASLHVRELLKEEALPFALACVRHARDELAAGSEAGSLSPLPDAELAARVLKVLPGEGKRSQLRPLHILLTAFVLVRLTEPAGTFEEVITAYLRHRVELRKQDFLTICPDVADVDRIFNLVCVATILRAIDLKDLPKHTYLPGESIRVISVGLCG